MTLCGSALLPSDGVLSPDGGLVCMHNSGVNKGQKAKTLKTGILIPYNPRLIISSEKPFCSNDVPYNPL